MTNNKRGKSNMNTRRYLISIIISMMCLQIFNNGYIFKAYNEFYKSGSNDSNYVELKKINDNIFLHITYEQIGGSTYPSNGLIIVTSKQLILVDTPWNNSQTKELFKLSKEVFEKDFHTAIVTHAHDDRIGGIDILLENKIDVWATELTIKEAEKNGFSSPNFILGNEEKINIDDFQIETFYPGKGHSPDNIVVYIPKYELLFGGCLIKSLQAKTRGSIKDADLQQWPLSVQKVLEKYCDSKIVIPGHGEHGDIGLLKHTIELLNKK